MDPSSTSVTIERGPKDFESDNKVADFIRQSPDYHAAGYEFYWRLIVNPISYVSEVFTPFGEKLSSSLKWSVRLLFTATLLGFTWMVAFGVALLNRTTPFLSVPSDLISAVEVLALFEYTSTPLALTGALLGLTLLGAIFFGVKGESTCSRCGKSFSLRSEGRWYRPEAVTTREREE